MPGHRAEYLARAIHAMHMLFCCVLVTALYLIENHLPVIPYFSKASPLVRYALYWLFFYGLGLPVIFVTRGFLREHSNAVTDQLTGVYSRQFVLQEMHKEIERAKRRGRDISIMILDVDRFKAFNDRCGHPGGDKVLRQVAHVLRSSVRETDCVGRYGGDEFLVILPDENSEGAWVVANRIQKKVRNNVHCPCPDQPALDVSIGIACLQKGMPSSVTALIQRADVAMYQTKREKQQGGEIYLPCLI